MSPLHAEVAAALDRQIKDAEARGLVRTLRRLVKQRRELDSIDAMGELARRTHEGALHGH
jgi:hypothetical protein